ncbi:MarR family winged helix-turn-helix transcriptional regulator [Rodentibacter caecimuris]|uniref:MarR family winged helix-turn-helix transcriptional regulator n=1 Tax=Rodentibacter caecimuris TaxID=1796644 RepID=UPI0025900E12|nr:MarR family transcriptional regulator [Rodentibacter heylii]
MLTQFDKLSDLSAKLSSLYANWAKQRGITLNELHFLYHIGRNGTSSPTAIGERWSLPKQTVTSICKQLDSKGYLQFITDEKDKRSKQIGLTEQGKMFIEPIISEITQIEWQTEQQYSSEKLTALLTEVEQLLNIFSHQLNQKRGDDNEYSN